MPRRERCARVGASTRVCLVASHQIGALVVVDEAYLSEDTVEYPVQVNGKVRDRISVPVDVTEDAAFDAAMASPRVSAAIGAASVKKTILVPGKLLNIVVRTA